MMICNDCGAVFENDDIYTYEEHHPYGMGYATETWSCCPDCGESDIEEAFLCKRCDEYVAESKLSFHNLCPICEDEMYGE
jgi:hypothetical protein